MDDKENKTNIIESNDTKNIIESNDFLHFEKISGGIFFYIMVIIICIIVFVIIYVIYDNYYSTINVDYTIFNNMGIYYINLDHSTERKKNIEDMCREHEIISNRIEGVNGKILDLNNPLYERALRNIKWWFLIDNRKNIGHFGCYLSHMKTYETFLKTNREYCLIFEDDAEFITPYLKTEIVHNMNNLPKDWDILLLGYEIDEGYDEVKEGNKDTKLKNGLLNINYFTGLHAYIINRKCAKKLIENLKELEWIIDWNISYLSDRGLLNIYGVYPPLVCQPAVHLIRINGINYQYQCKNNFPTLTNQ